jgi:PIN domain nuclease of toxin-antitoxin system
VIILDTHPWLWWVNESPKLSKSALLSIDQADRLGVHLISCWEVAMLVEKGRLGLRMDTQQWVELALQRPKVFTLPFMPREAVFAAQLPDGFHGDPADRFIVTSCLIHNAPLVTKDKRIRDWGKIPIVW